MNMIVNKSDLVGYEAVDRTEAKRKALAKIVAAWESKQAKNATRFGGLGFLAVSLAACNTSSDDTTAAVVETPVVTTPTVTALSSALAAGADVITSTFTSADDSVTATTATLGAGDVLVDGSSTDNDTLTVTMAAGGATTAPATITGVENVVYNNSSLANAPTIAADNIIGAHITVNNTANALVAPATATVNALGTNTTLTLGTNITGASTVQVGASASGTTINAGASEVTVNMLTAVSGLTVNGGTSGAMTVNMDSGNAGASAGANINANTTITTGSTAGAISITNNSATGTNVTTGYTGTTAQTITMTDVASDTVLTVGKAGSATSATSVVLEGVAATTDKVTLSAPGIITLETENGGQQVNALDLSGNGAAATYNLNGTTDAPTIVTMSGSQDVTLNMNLAQSDALNAAAASGVTDNTTAGTTTVQISDTVTNGKTFLKTNSDVLELQAAVTAAATFTVNNGATVNLTTVNQTNAFVLKVDDGATANATAGSMTLGLAKATTGAITTDQSADVLTAITVNATGVAQTALNLQAGATTDVTINGALAVTMNAAATAKSINASGMTASFAATINANLTNLTGGSGDDTFTGMTPIPASTTIDGGAGNDQFVAAATSANSNLTLTSIEVVDIGSGAGGANVSSWKASQLSGKDYIISSAGADNMKVDGTVAATDIDITAIDMSALQFADAAALVTVNVSADDPALFTSTQAFTVTGSATQANTITGSANADIITGGGLGDTLTGGNGSDTIDGGAGTDTITFQVETTAGDTITGGAGNDTIKSTTTGGATAGVTKITDFDLGTASTTADQLHFSLQMVEALTTVTDLVDTNANSAANTNGTIVAVTTDGGTISNADLVVLSQTYANDAAALAGMKTTGSDTIICGSALTDNDAILVAYTDGTNSYIAAATTSAGSTASNDFDSVETIVELTGVSSLANLDSGDYTTIT